MILIRFYIFILFLSFIETTYADINGLLVSDKGGLEDYSGFVVFIKEGKSLPKINLKNETVIMGQINKSFSPSVQGVEIGDSVDFVNYDDIYHNVFSLSPENKFDLGIYKGAVKYDETLKKNNTDKSSTRVSFNKSGKIKVYCNIHEDMMGTIYVFDHGYHVKVLKDGRFSMPAPIKGNVTIVVDGDRIDQPIERKISLNDKNEILKINFSAIDKKNIPKHLKKDGKEYEKSWSVDEDEFY